MRFGKCEWDCGHDQEQMVLMVGTPVEGATRLHHRNIWDDAPYSIAKAIRYWPDGHRVRRGAAR